MSAAPDLEQSQPQPKISLQMRAVLAIVSAEPALIDAVIPHIDFKNESIEWEKISRLHSAPATDAYVSGHSVSGGMRYPRTVILLISFWGRTHISDGQS